MNKKIILAILFLASGCNFMKSKEVKPVIKPVKVKEFSSIEKLDSYPQLYTLYNIHVDHKENRVFTVNYQLKGLVIPICTKVTIGDYNSQSLNFKAGADGKNYVYVSHRAVKDKLGDHLLKVFGPDCHRNEIGALSGIDKQGIIKAEALVGMTKKGVLYAIGNPPTNVNSNPQSSNKWLYWKDRWNKFSVIFNDRGIVESIKKESK
jgi:hypothetical protein